MDDWEFHGVIIDRDHFMIVHMDVVMICGVILDKTGNIQCSHGFSDDAGGMIIPWSIG